MTALTRGLTNWNNWELSGWGGMLYDQPAAAGGVTSSVFSAAVRGEISLRKKEDAFVLRTSLGVDRRFSLFQRDLYLVVELSARPFRSLRS